MSAQADIVLVHGWGFGRAAWQPLVDALPPERRSRVRCLDLPGYGEAAAIADFESTARAMLEATPPGALCCAWSLGALLALKAAVLAPDHFGALLLTGATASFTQRDGWPEAQPPSLLEQFSTGVAADAPGALQRFAALINQGDTQARPIARRLNQQLRDGGVPPTATLLAGLDWLGRADLRAELSGIRCPVLLAHGAHDPLMPLDAARRLQALLPQVRLEVFADAAHAPFLHDPDGFAELIGELSDKIRNEPARPQAPGP